MGFAPWKRTHTCRKLTILILRPDKQTERTTDGFNAVTCFSPESFSTETPVINLPFKSESLKFKVMDTLAGLGAFLKELNEQVGTKAVPICP